MKILLGLLSFITLSAPLANNVTYISTSKHINKNIENLAIGQKATSSLSVTGLTNEKIIKTGGHGSGTTLENSGFKPIGTVMYSNVNPINPPTNLNDMIVNQQFASFSFSISPIVNSSAGNEYLRPSKNINLSISASDIKKVNNINLWGNATYLLTADYYEQVNDWWDANIDSLPRENGWFWHCYDKTTGKSTDNYLYLVAREISGGATFGFVAQDRIGAGAGRSGHGGLRMNGSTTISIEQNINTGTDVDYLQKNINQTFNFQSKTSTDLTSTETRSIIDGKEYNSNATYIKNEFDRRLRDGLGRDFNAWNKLAKYNINNLFIDNSNKRAMCIFWGLPSNWKFPIILSMPINMTFDKDEIANKINSVFNQVFEFSSDMSSNISDDQANTTTQIISNHQLVMNEIQKRLDLLFGSHKTDWEKEIKISPSFNDATSSVIISFTDTSGAFIKNGQWLNQVTMPCKINLTDGFYNRSIEQRMQLTAGLISDPTSSQSGLVQDAPAYEQGSGTDGGTLTYHSAVGLTFTSLQDNSEKLYINGKAQDLKNNVFHVTLDSKPFDTSNTDNKPISYEIEVKNNTSTKLTLKVNIASVASSIGFTWEGWHPDEKGDAESRRQWLLTQAKITDNQGQQIDNPAYNSLIDTKTGLIEQDIFIKTSSSPKYPFPVDPLDKDGNLISYIEQQNPDQATKYVPAQDQLPNLMYGYIASAMVSQMGTSFTNDLNGLAINRVDRVQLNPDDFSEIGTPIKVDFTNEANFSTVGLWHYIIYLNNKVDGKPLDPTNLTDAPAISATQGSVINKIVYITGSGHEDEYQSFTDLDFVKNNSNVADFWTTVQARHLKDYLRMKNFTSVDIQTADYEHLMTYWNNYVQDVARGVSIPTPTAYINLNFQSGMAKILMNQTTDEGIKKKIHDAVEKYMTSISSDFIYNTDYIITNSANGTIPLEQLNVVDLEQTITNNYSASGSLVIKSLATSTKLIGTKSFDILNSAIVQENKVLDLSQVTFQDEEYNFSNLSISSFEHQYIDLYIHNILEQNRPANDYRPYVHGKDYEVSINELDVDYKHDNSGNSDLAINTFMKSDQDTLKISIKSISSSTKMVGANSYNITNSIAAPTPPMIKTDIASVFVNTNLGEFTEDEATNGYISKQQIWDRLLEVNEIDLDDPDNIYQNLVADNFNFLVLQNGTDTNKTPLYNVSIMTKVTDSNYTGSITATYTSLIPPVPDLSKLDINEIFLNKDLGEVTDTNNNGYIDKEEIWTKLLSINEINNYPDLKMSDFSIQSFLKDANDYYGQITALPTSRNYQGKVTITYTSQVPPNPADPDDEPDNNDGKTFNKINLAWIIPVALLILGGIITGLYFFMRHRKTKKKMK